MFKRLTAIGTALAVLAIGGVHYVTANASQYPSFPACHDDSTMVKPTGSHGGPTSLPGSENGDDGYYYLSITAGCASDAPGSTVTLVVHVHLDSVLQGQVDADGMCWRVDVHHDYSHDRLASALLMGNDITLTWPNAVAGTLYRIRIANMEPGVVVSDHSSVDG